MKRLLWISLILFPAQLFAQSEIPGGTILPVAFNASLNSRKVKPGRVITARVMQDVPLSPGSTIHAGAKVVGHVIDVKPATGTAGARLSLRFDTLMVSRRRIPITTNVRALASAMAVEDAQVPESGPDRGTSKEAWTTNQIGGEVVYRGGGPVANGLRSVGEPTYGGVLVHLSGKPGTECRGETEGNDRLQALWLFSSDACGIYGFANLVIVHAGRSNPVGEITLASERGDVNVKAGSGMLLRVSKIPKLPK
jgi:hypothetical protein